MGGGCLGLYRRILTLLRGAVTRERLAPWDLSRATTLVKVYRSLILE
jgi:hypothetical protein